MEKYPKSHLVNKQYLSKNSTMVGTLSRVSRVLTLLDVITLIKKDVPAAVINIDPVKTAKTYTLLSWVEGSGLQNKRSKIATWSDTIGFIANAGGTINLNLGYEHAGLGGVINTTAEMATYPDYSGDNASFIKSSEFITYTEMTHLMNNSTFI